MSDTEYSQSNKQHRKKTNKHTSSFFEQIQNINYITDRFNPLNIFLQV